MISGVEVTATSTLAFLKLYQGYQAMKIVLTRYFPYDSGFFMALSGYIQIKLVTLLEDRVKPTLINWNNKKRYASCKLKT